MSLRENVEFEDFYKRRVYDAQKHVQTSTK
jgi:hypothetical protein